MIGLLLDGEWLLTVDPENTGRAHEWWQRPAPSAVTCRVPGVLQEAFPGYHGVAWYWKEFEPPAHPQPAGGRYLLGFGAVDYLADAWLNGVYLGGHEGGETPFELDATDAIRPGDLNLLALRVLNPTNEPIDGFILAETPHRNKSIPPTVGGSYNYGGIVEPVELILEPCVHLADVFVRADLATGGVRVQVLVVNAGSATVSIRLWSGVTPAHGDMVLTDAEVTIDAAPGETRVELQTQVPKHRPWELEDPVLYRAVVRLASSDRVPNELSALFGFRDFRVVNGFFRLNDRRLFLKSTHTGNHCPFGQVVPPQGAPGLLHRDLLFAKSCGFNMVRFISGMAHPWQLDLCDKIGLMVYEECMAGWCLQDSPQMAGRFDRSVSEMILRDRNHPSVTIWGLLNETPEGPVSRRAVGSLGMIREIDDTRLVLLGSGRWDNDLGV